MMPIRSTSESPLEFAYAALLKSYEELEAECAQAHRDRKAALKLARELGALVQPARFRYRAKGETEAEQYKRCMAGIAAAEKTA